MGSNQFDSLEIPAGSEFALFALDSFHLSRELIGPVLLEPGIHLSARLPVPFDEFWYRERKAEAEGAANASAVILAVCQSLDRSNPDGRNAELLGKVDAWYWAFLLATPFASHGSSVFGTGVNAGEGAVYRSIGPLPPLTRMQGTLTEECDHEAIARARLLIQGIRGLTGAGADSRLWRMMRRFLEALRETEIGERLHGFVRVIEGIVLPRIGHGKVDFRQRIPMLCQGVSASEIGLIYDIRSSVSHLHSPFKHIPNIEKRLRSVELIRLTNQTEVLAREVLVRVFTNEAIWPFLQDAQTWEQMWGAHSERLLSLWGTRVDVSIERSGYRADLIDLPSLDSWEG